MYQYFLLAFPVAALLCWALASVLKKRGRREPVIFYGGLIYILIALPIVWSWFLYIAIGSIMIGLILIALSRLQMNTKLQLGLIALPIVIFLAFAWQSESSYNIFLIPEGYRGRVVVVHGCAEGAPREFEGRYRLYKIGTNGLLRSRFAFAGTAFDSLHSKYFFVDAQGNRRPIGEAPDGQAGTAVSIQGLWTLTAERTGDTFIDFIVDVPVADPHTYRPDEFAQWQNEIDSCRRQ